jgi:hypothetical protein
MKHYCTESTTEMEPMKSLREALGITRYSPAAESR